MSTSPYGIMGSLGVNQSGTSAMAGSGGWIQPGGTLGLMNPGTTSVKSVANQQKEMDPFIAPQWTTPTDTPVSKAVPLAANTVSRFVNPPQWGLIPTNTPIGQFMADDTARKNAMNSAITAHGPVNMGVVPGQGPAMNAVQQARMQQGGQSVTDPRQSVLAAYNQPGLGGSMPQPPPQQQPAPQQQGYSPGWTATSNPYSAPGAIKGQTVPMTPEIANILAQGRHA